MNAAADTPREPRGQPLPRPQNGGRASDVLTCPDCGGALRPAGACRVCVVCGSTTGCS
jgi:hypothetical protein